MVVRLQVIPQRPSPRLEYVLQYLNRHPLKPKGLSIGLELPAPKEYLRYGGKPSEGDWSMEPLEHFFHLSPDGPEPVPELFSFTSASGKEVVGFGNASKRLCLDHRFQADIFETIFFHLSRWEEYHFERSLRDKWGNLASKNQLLVRTGLHRSPVVDALVLAFFESLGFGSTSRKSSFTLTHDVDVLQKFKPPGRVIRTLLGIIWRGEGVQGLQALWQNWWRFLLQKQPDPYDQFELMLQQAAPFSNKLLFLMSGGKTRHDNWYQLEDYTLKEVVQLAEACGYTIGLHPSYATPKNTVLLLEEKKKLERWLDLPIRLSRQHFLRFAFPETIRILEKAGIREDYSLGFNDRIGFRAGTGFPFYLYDLHQDRISRVRTFPLHLMDTALLTETKEQTAEAATLALEFLRANQYNTALTINIHNHVFDPIRPYGLGMQAWWQWILKNVEC